MRFVLIGLICVAAIGCTHDRIAALVVDTLCLEFPAICDELSQGGE